jgi:hypothetical protein
MKRINIKSPTRLCTYANGVITSWKLTYIGLIVEKGTQKGIYNYTLTDKENNKIKIGVEIYSEIQQMYDPNAFQKDRYVKIFCKDLNQPLKRGVTKMMRVDEFKEVRRVFNTLHDAGRQLLS